MKKYILPVIAILVTTVCYSQKRYYTRSGNISFEAGTALEDIDAVNKSAACIFDAGTGQIEYSVLIKGFEFKRALMQEHFNENYLESDKYPKSVFKGRITDVNAVNFTKDGIYPVTVKGDLEMHGIKKPLEAKGTMKVNGETVLVNATFNVLLADYNIEIPSLVKDKIDKTVKINVVCLYNLLK